MFALRRLLLVLPLALLAGSAIAQDTDSGRVVATVNGDTITEGDVQFLYRLRRVPENERAARREQIVDRLIDRALMRQVMAAEKVVVDDQQVQSAGDQIKAELKRGGDDPAKLFPELGLTEDRYKAEVALPLQRKIYLTRQLTPDRLRTYFDNHREEFDGTTVAARQIFRRVAKDATKAEAAAEAALLKRVKADLAAGITDFAAAANEHSQSPSAAKGGSLGEFTYRGEVPAAVAEAAFAADPGTLVGPVRSPFGWHLLSVDAKTPGELSLEDVRNQVRKAVGEQLWLALLKKKRESANIIHN